MSRDLPGFGEASATVTRYAAALLESGPRTRPESLENSLGRVLAQTLHADRDMPMFPRSTRDGFACRAAEACAAEGSGHKWLKVEGLIRAGDPPATPLSPGAACEIMTGAAVPEGADAVAMLEHVEHTGGKIRFAAGRTLDPGENIVPAGAEARSGDTLVSSGIRLGPAHIAVAASCGYQNLQVFARPRVAILTTGDELVPVAATPGPGKIRNSNAPMLAALVANAGGEPLVLPSARDDAAVIESALNQALDQALESDMLLISGGVSAGKFDLVEPSLARLGARFFFTGVRIQPGKPLVFGELPRTGRALPFFGLPGNPISSAATFLLFAAQVLAALAGSRAPVPRFSLARLARSIKGKPGLTRFVPSATTIAHGLPEVAPVGSQGSGDLASFARADCFLRVPEGTDRLAAGDEARILPI